MLKSSAPSYKRRRATDATVFLAAFKRAGTGSGSSTRPHLLGRIQGRGAIVYIDWLRRAYSRDPLGGRSHRGNFGQAIAFAARREAGKPSSWSLWQQPRKNRAMRALGAELIEHGTDFQAAVEFAQTRRRARSLRRVLPSALVHGTATYAMELLRGLGSRHLYVPIGMGSSICGMIAARNALGHRRALSALSPALHRLCSVVPRTSPASVAVTTKLADGLACASRAAGGGVDGERRGTHD